MGSSDFQTDKGGVIQSIKYKIYYILGCKVTSPF